MVLTIDTELAHAAMQVQADRDVQDDLRYTGVIWDIFGGREYDRIHWDFTDV